MLQPSRLLFILLLLLTGCGPSRFESRNASGHYVDDPVQCVTYAREVSGIEIYGDAHTWWDQAPPRYLHSSFPQPGAVLVLSRTSKLPRGHLAVVKDVVGSREIDITHSNWGNDSDSRCMIYESMRVEDISTANDWSLLRFWNRDAQTFGFPYAAKGFISRY